MQPTLSSVTQALPRRWLTTVISLIVISSALLVAGIALERNAEINEATPVPTGAAAKAAATPATNAGEGAGENAEQHAAEASGQKVGAALPATGAKPATDLHQESIFGFNLENPWVVGGNVVVWLVLAALLARLGCPLLPVVTAVALLAAALDVREIVAKLGAGQTGLALLALVVTLGHLAVAILCGTMLLRRTTSASLQRATR